MRKILFGWAVFISMLVTPAVGEPLVRVHTSYYYIDGTSAAVLAAQLDQKGPVGSDGHHYAGKTRWDIQWRFRHEQQGTRCVMKDVAVAVGIAQTLPKWRGESRGAGGLKALWSKFTDALQRHEDAHKAHGMNAGKEIEAAVLAVKPASNCEDLEMAGNTAAQAIVTKYQGLDEEYDRTTDHGRNQGATLL
jgi:predicted secreted Zn-dependent protease